jgi:RHO1 GDP-GTP exchange protein 1/2
MLVRQREQGPIIQRIGDIFLGAAAEFRMVYPVYVGNLPVAEKRVKEEAENNAEFRRFLEVSRALRKFPLYSLPAAKRSARRPRS